MCTWVRMSQNLVSMWLRAKNNYCRGLTKGFYHCAFATNKWFIVPLVKADIGNIIYFLI
jgi:hypothetical protein